MNQPVDEARDTLERLVARGDLLGVATMSVVVVVVVLVLRWALLRFLQRQVDEPESWYRTRKTVNYSAAVVILLALGNIWVDGVGTLVTVLALVGAGLVIALGEVVRNLAGGLYIALRHPLRIGDRVEIEEHAGDVVGVGAFGFTLLEIRNWVDADQSTGRLLHVPNNLLFSRPLANFGAGLRWIWHEVSVPLTFESDWRRALELLEEIVARHAPDLDDPKAAEAIRHATRQYLIRYTHLTPTVYVDADDHGIRLTGRLLCEMRRRRGVNSRIWTDVLEAFAAEPGIEFAYPPTRAYLRGLERLPGGPSGNGDERRERSPAPGSGSAGGRSAPASGQAPVYPGSDHGDEPDAP